MHALLTIALAVAGAAPPDTTADQRAVAVRADESPRLDGRLDDAVWARAVPASGFVQREPVEGEPAPERTEVRFLYTDEALYIGARMFSDDPWSIRALVARRDRDVPSEQLIVSFDTRLDLQTAYTFAITPGGVRTDYFHPADRETARDYSFDPVWEAETHLDSLGWTAEIRIPFTQLRFNPGSRQVWGLNLARRVPARNEEAFWVLVGRAETGWSSRMGRLTGIEGIRPSRRIELLPYVASEATAVSEVDPANPFSESLETRVRAGADLKMGLGPVLTLDATLNPDFGQVEADPAEVNLTAFETFFSERRPFFIEGANLFGGRGHFYSRRIGAPPPGAADAPYAEAVDNTTILGAAKVTGRFPSGFSLGALAALTNREEARTFDPASGAFGREIVAPLAGYGIVTARQEFGRDRSTLSGTVTAVERDVEAGTPLAAAVTHRAYTGLADGRWRWAGGRYDVSAYAGLTWVEGDPAAILALQRSSRHYFQRPDADHVTVDPARTSLTGVNAGINHSKMAGSWLWDIDYTLESPGLEPNDLGALGSADDHGLFANVRYRQTRPGALFHGWDLGVFQSSGWNFGGTRTSTVAGVFGGVTWKNFWRTDFEVDVIARAQSDALTRGGPLMQTPAGWLGFVGLSNSRGARTRWNASAQGGTDELAGWHVIVRGGVSVRAGTRLELSVEPGYTRRVTPQQYVATRSGGPAATFGNRYVFAQVERSELVAQLRASFAIQPDLTLEAYLEPFASSGDFREYGELTAAATMGRRVYGGDGTTITAGDGAYDVTDGGDAFTIPDLDFNVRSLRSNLVVRWEWRPGSTLFLVWQQDRFQRRQPGAVAGPDGLLQAFGAPGDHFLAIKASYWIAVR